MPIRVSPDEVNPTHHIAIQDRDGNRVGLILCDDKGQPLRRFNKIPIETTALKQTSGSSSYDIFDYPYSPIVQDDWSGGRGSKDFERDSTKYYDAFRAKSGRPNMVHAGPQEYYPYPDAYAQVRNMPGSVYWLALHGTASFFYRRVQATGNVTAVSTWILARCVGSPADMTIGLYADSAGAIGAKIDDDTISSTDLADKLISEWVQADISASLTTSTYYWIVISAAATDSESNHWLIGASATGGYSSAAFDSTPTTTPSIARGGMYHRIVPVCHRQNLHLL